MAWDQLVGFIQEAREIEQADRTGTPTSCPADYTALRQADGGELFCPWCGLRWPEDAPLWGEFPGAF